MIGREGELPWRLPSDLRRFKRLTMGHHLIVGRKTWQSIGRPLPGRRMVVVSRRPDLELPPEVERVGSPEAAVERARRAGEEEAFVAGGAEIYAHLLDRADRLYLTDVLADVEGDAYFPAVDLGDWSLVGRVDRPATGGDSDATRFTIWDRER